MPPAHTHAQVKLSSLLYGGGQELGRRAGTESVLLIVRSGVPQTHRSGVSFTDTTSLHSLPLKAHTQLLKFQLPSTQSTCLPALSIS